jgi:hypothetical protein
MARPSPPSARLVLALLVCLHGTSVATAQPAPATGTIVIGSLTARPRVALANVGVDSNVFNEPEAPKSDRTFTLAPAIEWQWRIRRATIDATTTGSYIHFQKFYRERSWNPSHAVGIELPFNRLTLRSGYSFVSTRERPSPEIDVRARRIVSSPTAGLDLHLGSKTVVRLDAAQTDFDFRADSVPAAALQRMLTRRSRELRLSLRYPLSSLTTLVFSGERLTDRFEYAPNRDADGSRLMPGLEFGRFALVSGGASVGWREFRPSSSLVPPYSGVAARVRLSSVVRGRVWLEGIFDRDISYSFSAEFPYYVQTMVNLAATYRLGASWDMQLSAGRQRLAYRETERLLPALAPDAAVTTPDILKSFTYGGSLGFSPRPGLRLSLNVRGAGRESGPTTLPYDSWQTGVTIAYGY